MLKRMKVWQKLVAMGILFMIPLLIVTYAMVSSMRTLGIVFAEKEISGTEYQAPLRKLLELMQSHRGLANGILRGDASLTSKIEPMTGTIQAALAAIQTVDQGHGRALETTEKVSALRDQVAALENGWRNLSPEESFKRHSEAIADILVLFSHVANASNLAFDPHQDSYYLMDATTFAIPELSEIMGQLRGLCNGIAARGAITTAERDVLNRKAALVTYYVDRLKSAYQRLTAINPEAGGRLETSRAAAALAATGFVTALENDFIAASAITIKPTEWWDTATKALGASFTLYDQSLPVLSELLTTRIAKLSNEMYQTIAWVVLGIVLVSIVGFFIMRDISQPLTKFVQATKRIEAGDLSVTLNPEGRRDEIGALGDAFAGMTEALRATARQQMQQVTEGVNILSNAASEILVALTQVVAGASETASAVNEAATTVEEVKQTAQVASLRATDVATSAQNAVRVSQTGERAVDDAVDGMTKVRTQMESIAESVVRLGEQSRAIGEIIAAVNDLAEQSNLLAVNAGIEAAKAGEQGKGFAVVAQEVKSLATQSKQATQQVRQLLSDIQKAANVAVMVTEQGTKSAETGVKQSIDAGESIRALAKSISDAAQSVGQITASSQQQLVGMDQVASAMQNIKEASTQNVDSMKQIEISVQNLSEVSASLQDVVSRYSVRNGAEQAAA